MSMKNLFGKKKAFSLVELMIVIGIIGIMSSVTIISMQGGKTEKELEVAAREVSATIREAQSNSLSGKNASSDCQHYDFTYAASSANYSVGTVSGSGCPLSRYMLENGVVFANGGSFSFAIPFGRLGDVSGGYSIRLNKRGSDYYVCLNDSGNVFEQKSPCP